MQPQTFTYYHGTNTPDAVIEALLGSDKIRTGFHMAPRIETAANYGNHVIAIELEQDIESAHIGMINKASGNYNAAVGNAVEVVLKTPAAVNELYAALYNAEIIN